MLNNTLLRGGLVLIGLGLPTAVVGIFTGLPVAALGAATAAIGAGSLGTAIRRAFYVAPRD